MHIKSQKDFFSGLMFVVAGVAFAWDATTYNLGDSARMGPGYFPLLLGVVLALIGAIVLFTSLVVETEGGDKVGSWAWRPLFFILIANLLFGVLLAGLPSIGLPALGLIAAVFGLTIAASMAHRPFSLRPTLLLAAILAAVSYLACTLLLELQIQLWPAFVTG